GIVTALSRMEDDRVLIVAVDQPFVRTRTLARLGELDSMIPVVPVDQEGVRQVTCALYPKAIASAAMEEAEADGSIQSLLDRVSFQAVTPEIWSLWGEDGRSWFSVDTPGALEEGVRRFL
ncbi:MAG: NTP transferase domain-containing protein, partial [Acidimicrobiia bacterium]